MIMPRPLLLIVVDSESLRTPGLGAVLEREGWEVQSVGRHDAEAFLAAGREPDLLLLDSAASEATGCVVARALRLRKVEPPILVLGDGTGQGSAMDVTVREVLSPMLPEEEVAAAVRRYLPQPAKLTTDDIFGDLLADLDWDPAGAPAATSSAPAGTPAVLPGFAPVPPPPVMPTAAPSPEDPFALFGELPAAGAPAPAPLVPDPTPFSAQDLFGDFVEEGAERPVSSASQDFALPTPAEASPSALRPSEFTLSGISGVHDPFEWAGVQPPQAAAVQLAPGATLSAPESLEEYGNYFLLEKIAVGGMAELFKAQQRGVQGFQKIVAIKRILPHFSDNEDFVTMFIDEAKLAAQLTHPNIVQIFDLGKAGSSYYIAMEYVNGRDLRTLLKKVREYGQPFPEQVAAFVVMKVAAALDYAHRKRGFDDRELKLVHRDISPQNVLLSTEGAVKLVDFGIAKAASKASHTVAGALKGKLLYMSPEQALGQPVDNRSDLYSLGLVLFELLTGERCFQADSEFGVLEKVRLGRVSDIQYVNPRVSKEMAGIVSRALQKGVDHRYPSARFLERDLRDYLQRQGRPIAEHDVAEYMTTLLSGSREDLEALVAARFPAPIATPALTSGAHRVGQPLGASSAGTTKAPVRDVVVELPPEVRIEAPPRPRWLLPVILGLAVLIVGLLLIAGWS
jgi:CheY-like chemotaxis protein